MSRCGYAVLDKDGNEQPCDRPATGWRWYQDVEHEDALDVACDLHENEGGRRLAAAEARAVRAEAAIQRVEKLVSVVENRMMATAKPAEIRAALAGEDSDESLDGPSGGPQ